jgi:hypothetical protein
MEPNTQLVKTVKHLMVDKGIGIGYWLDLKDKASERLGRPIHRNTFYNALLGYRLNKSETEILTALQGILEEMPDK